jgi:hypothetical protein
MRVDYRPVSGLSLPNGSVSFSLMCVTRGRGSPNPLIPEGLGLGLASHCVYQECEPWD